jgi:predicted oxidoreductase (fatty acid repression mutant protein)
MSSNSFFEAVKSRRSYYQLNKTSPLSDEQITKLAEEALLHVPSSFNSQSTRLVVLLNKDHEQFWDFVLEVLKPMVPAEQFPTTEQKIGGFRAAYGTVSAILICYATPTRYESLDRARKTQSRLRRPI